MLDLQVVDLIFARMIDKDFLEDLRTIENIVFRTCRQFRITLSINWHRFILRKEICEIWGSLIFQFSLQHTLKNWYAYSDATHEKAKYAKSIVGLRFCHEKNFASSALSEFYWHFYSKRTTYIEYLRREQQFQSKPNVIEALDATEQNCAQNLVAPESEFVRMCISNDKVEKNEHMVMFQISANQFYNIKQFVKESAIENIKIGLACAKKQSKYQDSVSIGYSYIKKTKRSFDEAFNSIECKLPDCTRIGLPVDNLVYVSQQRQFIEINCKKSTLKAALEAIVESNDLQVFQILFKMKKENFDLVESISIAGFAKSSFFCNVLSETC
jgi:hypothetical protein